jgi:hypothetical protein
VSGGEEEVMEDVSRQTLSVYLVLVAGLEGLVAGLEGLVAGLEGLLLFLFSTLTVCLSGPTGLAILCEPTVGHIVNTKTSKWRMGSPLHTSSHEPEGQSPALD